MTHITVDVEEGPIARIAVSLGVEDIENVSRDVMGSKFYYTVFLNGKSFGPSMFIFYLFKRKIRSKQLFLSCSWDKTFIQTVICMTYVYEACHTQVTKEWNCCILLCLILKIISHRKSFTSSKFSHFSSWCSNFLM